MSKVGLIILVLIIAQILVLQAMPHDEAAVPREVSDDQKSNNKIAVDQPVNSGSNNTNSTSSSLEESKTELAAAEGPNYRRLGNHHSTDKSVAGGGVIIGGLVTATFAAVFCYIRVTRKRESVY
ncbi:hypothetical protein RIF29_27334 [Crotalaria pallida]|uniref:Transmembrane protein n=1 Tax=Crotalaria pallida TaxID=3830 RepID=A0AAN9ER80_CROPI